MALSKTTQDHEEIRRWAEARGAKPADVESTEREGQAGIIRLEFPKAPNANDRNLKEVSWEEFFEKFDASGLAFLYQDVTADGEQSNFNRFLYPENAKTPVTPNTSGKDGAPGGDDSEDDEAFEDAAVDEPGDKDADEGDEDDDEFVHETAEDNLDDDEDAEEDTPSPAKKSATRKSASKSSAKKAAANVSSTQGTGTRSAKSAIKTSTGTSARGRH
jgi:hypothetical protein